MLPLHTYQSRAAHFENDQNRVQRTYNWWATGRLVWFFVTILIAYVLFKNSQTAGGWATLGAGILGFVVLLRKHLAVKKRLERFKNLVFVNKDEAARTDLIFLRPETGVEFVPVAHPYCTDLDLFGKHAIYRLLNRTHTQEGAQKLANWLLYPADTDEIHLRQEAVEELKNKIDWQQDLQATALAHPAIEQPTAFLHNWINEPANARVVQWQKWRWLLPACTICSVVLAFFGYIISAVPVGLYLVSLYITSRTSNYAKYVSEKTTPIVGTLSGIASLAKQVEDSDFKSTKLKHLRWLLRSDGASASAAIAQLRTITDNLSFRLNPYFALVFGIPLLWDLHALSQLETWKQNHRHALGAWLNALAEAEGINSLAGFALANPDFIVPQITLGNFEIDLTQVGHPLIGAQKRVANDFNMTGVGQTALITGANMAGKSTFLRTVALNLVLAQMGAVVCARSFRCAPLRLFTSMRTQDSLEENTSSFYAELKRLKTLLELSETPGDTILYFLDEILKGTNSADRHNGARALILQLHDLNASGFVSTHDIELGALGDTHSFVKNYHVHSDVKDGELIFDYLLQDGICRSFNASQLMRALGIKL